MIGGDSGLEPDQQLDAPGQAPHAFTPADIILGAVFCLFCTGLGGLAGWYLGIITSRTLACLLGFPHEAWRLGLLVVPVGGLLGLFVGGIIGLVTVLRRGRMWVVAIWLVVVVVVLFGIDWGVGSVVLGINEPQLE